MWGTTNEEIIYVVAVAVIDAVDPLKEYRAYSSKNTLDQDLGLRLGLEFNDGLRWPFADADLGYFFSMILRGATCASESRR